MCSPVKDLSPLFGLQLRHNLVRDIPEDVRQPEVTAGVAIGQAFVVKAEQVENRGVEIMDVHRLLDGLESKFVRGAVDVAALHPPPAIQMVKP